MNNDINLAAVSGVKRISGRLFIFSLVLFIILFVTSGALIFYSLLLKMRASNLGRDSNSIRGQISSFSKQKETALLISERLAGVKRILSQRTGLDTKASSIIGYMPDAFNIESIRGDEKLISVTISGRGLLGFDSFLEGQISHLSKDKGLNVKRIDIESFAEKGSGYVLGLNFYFTEKEAKR